MGHSGRPEARWDNQEDQTGWDSKGETRWGKERPDGAKRNQVGNRPRDLVGQSGGEMRQWVGQPEARWDNRGEARWDSIN